MKLLLDVKGLAEALSMPVVTVRQYASRHPEKLPPRLKLPSRRLLWSVKDVEDWIEKHRQRPAEPEMSNDASA